MTEIKINSSKIRMLTLADGGSLVALQKKGNLSHVETLYNPGNYFSEVHILVFNKEDLLVHLNNPTLKVHYLSHWPRGKLGLIVSLPFLLFQVMKIIRKYNIQVIRSRNAYMAGLLGVLAGKWMRIPTVISLGGDNRLAQSLLGHYYGGSRFLSCRLEEFSLRRAQRVFCVNEFTRQYAMRLGVPSEKTRIVPHRLDIDLTAYDGDTASIREELGFGDEPVIVIIGRLEKDKQVDVVIESIPLVQKSYPHARFIFVGDGRLRTTLESRIQELQLNKIVNLVGFKSRDKVIKYLTASTIVCIPMSGFVIYEAAAAKKPIVAFDVEWHSEFIQNGISGVLAKNRDLESLANAIIGLLTDMKLANSLAEKAHAKLREQFDDQVLIKKEITWYQELFLA